MADFSCEEAKGKPPLISTKEYRENSTKERTSDAGIFQMSKFRKSVLDGTNAQIDTIRVKLTSEFLRKRALCYHFKNNQAIYMYIFA